jgi:hypothetical protein
MPQTPPDDPDDRVFCDRTWPELDRPFERLNTTLPTDRYDYYHGCVEEVGHRSKCQCSCGAVLGDRI